MATTVFSNRPRALLTFLLVLPSIASAEDHARPEADPAAVERGRKALLGSSFLGPAWGPDAYDRAGALWGADAASPEGGREAYDQAFRSRYGLHPAPYPNDGLPMGLRRATNAATGKAGIQVDCLFCHGGSIGGTSYVGLGNTQLDAIAAFRELSEANDSPLPFVAFTVNTARGTVNAGQMSAFLLSFRNKDLSRRLLPLPLGARFVETDTPPWWNLKHKKTMYYDGRTDGRSTRSIMQFMLGEYTAADFERMEPTFRDVHAYIRSLEPPAYPFPIDRALASTGRVLFEKNCSSCHGTYGPGGSYPDRIVELDVVGTDPARALAGTDRLVSHYNSTWFGRDYPADEELIGYVAPPLDGIWASAPYLHNGSVPTLHHLLKSTDRPSRFLRPPSTDFEHYDTALVGWKSPEAPSPTPSPDDRRIFDASREGLGNQGHTFGDRLTDDERAAVIEYLKTL